jgi:hypothetical protein
MSWLAYHASLALLARVILRVVQHAEVLPLDRGTSSAKSLRAGE